MERSSYNPLLYRLIQLASIVGLFTLPPGYAREVQHAATPKLRLQVQSQELKGANRVIQVTITNISKTSTSATKIEEAVRSLNQCYLSFPEQKGNPVNIYIYDLRAGKMVKTGYPAAPLTALIDTTTLAKPGQSVTCDISLEPQGYSSATLILSVTNGMRQNARKLVGPVSVTWRKGPSLFTRLIDASLVVGITALCCSVAILIGGASKDRSRGSVGARQSATPLQPSDDAQLASPTARTQVPSDAEIDLKTFQECITQALRIDGYTYSETMGLEKCNNTILIGFEQNWADFIRTVANKYKGPYCLVSATQIAPNHGGITAGEIRKQLLCKINGKVVQAQKGVVVITDMDSFSSTGELDVFESLGQRAQQNLLPLLRDPNICVICLGDFNEIQSSKGVCTSPDTDLTMDRLRNTLGNCWGLREVVLNQCSICHVVARPWAGKCNKISDGEVYSQSNIQEAIRASWTHRFNSASSSSGSGQSPRSEPVTTPEAPRTEEGINETSSESGQPSCSGQEVPQNVHTSSTS